MLLKKIYVAELFSCSVKGHNQQRGLHIQSRNIQAKLEVLIKEGYWYSQNAHSHFWLRDLELKLPPIKQNSLHSIRTESPLGNWNVDKVRIRRKSV